MPRFYLLSRSTSRTEQINCSYIICTSTIHGGRPYVHYLLRPYSRPAHCSCASCTRSISTSMHVSMQSSFDISISVYKTSVTNVRWRRSFWFNNMNYYSDPNDEEKKTIQSSNSYMTIAVKWYIWNWTLNEIQFNDNWLKLDFLFFRSWFHLLVNLSGYGFFQPILVVN